MFKKSLSIGIILLFIVSSFIPIVIAENNKDDFVSEDITFRDVYKIFYLGTLNKPVEMNETYFFIEAKCLLFIEYFRFGFSTIGISYELHLTGLNYGLSVSENMELKFVGIKTDKFICGVLSII